MIVQRRFARWNRSSAGMKHTANQHLFKAPQDPGIDEKRLGPRMRPHRGVDYTIAGAHCRNLPRVLHHLAAAVSI